MAVMSPFSQISRQFGPEKGPNAFNQREQNIMGEKIAKEQQKLKQQIPGNLNTASFFAKNAEKERLAKQKQLEKDYALENLFGLPRYPLFKKEGAYAQQLESARNVPGLSREQQTGIKGNIQKQEQIKKQAESKRLENLRKKELENKKIRNILKSTAKNVGMTALRELPDILSLFRLV